MGAVATLFVAGCSGSSSRVSTGSATTTGLPGVTTSTTPTTSAPLVGASTTPVSTPIQGHAKLVAIRVGDQGGFDRVTFEFRDGLPGFHVRYISRPVQEDASGKTIEVASVVMRPRSRTIAHLWLVPPETGPAQRPSLDERIEALKEL